jgi:hypothetical protein
LRIFILFFPSHWWRKQLLSHRQSMSKYSVTCDFTSSLGKEGIRAKHPYTYCSRSRRRAEKVDKRM